MASHPTTTATYPPRAYTQTNPIDLTLDDDDDDIHVTERMHKRPCTMTRSFNAACPSASTPSYSRQSSSGLSPAMSHSTLAPPDGFSTPSSSQPSQASSSAHYYRDDYDSPSPNALRFKGPSTSAAFFQPQSSPSTSANPLDHPLPPLQHSPFAPHHSNGASRQVIDLTGSPSPPPSARYSQPPPPPPQYPTSTFGNLPPDLPPKTPVCIGVLVATALVLYPIAYLNPQDPSGQDCDWAPVRLNYEHNASKPPGSTETIHIRPPSSKGPSGEFIQGENFAVVEQKVATFLGPMLGKGLIRLDAKIRRGNRAVSTHIVIFCASPINPT